MPIASSFSSQQRCWQMTLSAGRTGLVELQHPIWNGLCEPFSLNLLKKQGDGWQGETLDN
jgi:hypothetical protein